MNRNIKYITLKMAFIRHGMTFGNEEKRYIGRTDEGLSDKGKNEILEKKQGQIYPQADVVYASPMKRCVKTAELIYSDKDLSLAKDWTEIDFGDFEGKNYKELSGNEDYQRWIDSNGELPFPNGESKEGFIERCKKEMTYVCKSYIERKMKNSNKKMKQKNLCDIAAVVHGGTIMAVLSGFSNGEYYDFQCKNGEGYIFDVNISLEGGKLEVCNIRSLC